MKTVKVPKHVAHGAEETLKQLSYKIFSKECSKPDGFYVTYTVEKGK